METIFTVINNLLLFFSACRVCQMGYCIYRHFSLIQSSIIQFYSLIRTSISQTPQYPRHLNIPDTSISQTPQYPRHLNIPDTSISQTPQYPRHLNIPDTSISQTPQYPRHLNIPDTSISQTPQYPRHLNIPEKVSLHHRFLNMGKIGHGSEKVSPRRSVP